ncbi:MAG: TFIIB-type zinc ribbon-containing protein [Anaerolineae bacterium]|nr:TFIIB-type zinc ribbon-containing protein [Anaerolineae bacterium]
MFPSNPFQPGQISQKEYENIVREGITAAKNGNRVLAHRLLTRAMGSKPNDARPYLWLSATTDDPHEQRQYLEWALACDPNLDAARKGLARLNEKLGIAPMSGIGEPTPAGASSIPDQVTDTDGGETHYGYDESSGEEIIQAESEVFECPNCGWRMFFDPEHKHLYCESCGHTIATEDILAADTAEAPMVHVMDSPYAHTWARRSIAWIVQSVGRLQCRKLFKKVANVHIAGITIWWTRRTCESYWIRR